MPHALAETAPADTSTPLPPRPDLAARLRSAIAAVHDAIERTPFAVGMVKGSLSKADYCAGLRPLAGLHDILEAALKLGQRHHPAVLAAYQPETMDRAAVARADLAALGDATPIDHAHPVLAHLRSEATRWAHESPAGLLGALYVLEGSRMGSMILVKSLSRAWGVPAEAGHGVDYHLDPTGGRPQHWGRFRAQLAALQLAESEVQSAEAGAVLVMESLRGLYAGTGSAPQGGCPYSRRAPAGQ